MQDRVDQPVQLRSRIDVTTKMTAEELRAFYLRYVELANNREFDRMHEFAHDDVIMNGTVVARGEWNGLAPTGASVQFAETAFYQVVDGRFKVMSYLMDADTLRQQLAG
jgi:predicted ester cyclase